jgi:hypothetical protein
MMNPFPVVYEQKQSLRIQRGGHYQNFDEIHVGIYFIESMKSGRLIAQHII